MRIRYPYVFAPLLLLLTMGSTECESYQTVTVPSADTTPPSTIDGVWWDGEYKVLKTGSNVINYHLAPGETSVLAVSSGLDSGGVKRLYMYSNESWQCCLPGPTSCTNFTNANLPYSELQPGAVGSSVSNGMWYGVEAKKRSTGYPDCPGGKYVNWWKFNWHTRAENFHGQFTIGPTHTIMYP